LSTGNDALWQILQGAALNIVIGKASVIMQDAASYQKLLDELEVARSAAMIQQGMAEAAAGKDQDAVEALEEFRSKYDIPR
jgi:predicted transcriptional regulator